MNLCSIWNEAIEEAAGAAAKCWLSAAVPQAAHRRVRGPKNFSTSFTEVHWTSSWFLHFAARPSNWGRPKQAVGVFYSLWASALRPGSYRRRSSALTSASLWAKRRRWRKREEIPNLCIYCHIHTYIYMLIHIYIKVNNLKYKVKRMLNGDEKRIDSLRSFKAPPARSRWASMWPLDGAMPPGPWSPSCLEPREKDTVWSRLKAPLEEHC